MFFTTDDETILKIFSNMSEAVTKFGEAASSGGVDDRGFSHETPHKNEIIDELCK